MCAILVIMKIVPYVRLFLRGCAQVALVSANVVQVSSGHYYGAFVVGTAISVMWYSNTRAVNKPRVELPGAGLCYGVGAGTGTLFGMYLARLL